MSPPHRVELLPGVIAAARRVGLDPPLVAAVVQQESGFDPQARRGEGPGTALGLMGLSLDLARWVGYEGEPGGLLDPRTSLDLGSLYLRYLVERYQGDVPRALAAYRAGPALVEREGSPEGEAYAAAVLQDAERLRPEVEALAPDVPEEPSDFAPLFRFPLPVPHVNQVIVEGGRSEGWVNCGPACVSMAVLYNRLARPSPEVIKRVAEEMRGMPWTARVFTNFDQMRSLARRRGVPFRNIYRWDDVFVSLDAGQPVVVLVDNTVPVPRQYPTGPGWAAAHFIVLTGYDESSFFVNDPLNQGWHGVPAGPAHYTGASVRRACASVSAQQRLGVEVMAIAIDRLPQPDVPRRDGALGGVDANEFPPEFALPDEQLARYLGQLGTPVNMETAIIRRACLAYRHGETRGPAISGEYPAQAPDGRAVVRQDFTAGIAEYDPQTGGVGWVELVARPDALRSR